MKKVEIVIPPEQLETLDTPNVTFRSALDFQLTDRDLQQAHLELGETLELRTTSLEKLREMLLRDEDLQYCVDDHFLLRYLRFRKYDCEAAYKTMRRFYRNKITHPETFVLPSNLESLLDMNLVRLLPFRDEGGSVIFWIDTKNWIIEDMSLCNLFQVANVVSDLVSMNPSCQVNSIVGIYNASGLTSRHIAQYFYPSTVKMLIQCLQDNYPWRIKRIIITHCSPIFRGIYRAVSYMIKKKIFKRIILLGSDVEELHQYVNPILLPKQYGGQIDESQCSITRFIMDNLKYLEYERSFTAK